MTKDEWLEAFETINGRSPSPQEFQEAREAGEFTLEETISETAGPIENSEKVCPRCKEVNGTGSPFCPNCGAKMDGTGNAAADATGGFVSGIANKLDSVTGGEGAVDLRLRDLFSQVFKPHTREEAAHIFACGSEATTPRPEEISQSWPKPWYFARVFGLLLVSTLMLYFMLVTFDNPIAIPGWIFLSAMTGAIPVLFFYFECNSPRNIDIMTVMEVFFIGGLLSLILTHVLGTIFPGGTGELVPSMMTGLVEEVGKILATGWFISRLKGRRYIFNGLLIGGAVGAGFAVFETAGYIYAYSVESGLGEGVFIANLRGLLAFGGHVAWAAITGAGIMMALKKYKEFNWSALWSGESLRFLIFVIILHGIWDMNPILGTTNKLLEVFVLCVLAWIAIFVIISRGLKEINNLGKVEKDLTK